MIQGIQKLIRFHGLPESLCLKDGGQGTSILQAPQEPPWLHLDRRGGPSLQDLNKYLLIPLILIAPLPREELFMYLEWGPLVVSTVLVIEQREPHKIKKV